MMRRKPRPTLSLVEQFDRRMNEDEVRQTRIATSALVVAALLLIAAMSWLFSLPA